MDGSAVSEVPVVIAGAGPTGLMLASELRLAGVEVVVVERLLAAPVWSRAQTLQLRSIETFHQRGLDWFGEYGQVRTHNFGLLELIGAVDPELIAKRVPQRDIEVKLEQRARELGAEVRRGHELTALEQDGDGVTVTVRHDGGDYRLRAAYLVGADGGRSSVRKLAGIPFVGGPSPYTFSGVTGDIELVDPEPLRIGPDLHPRGLFAVIPMEPGVHRVTVLEFGATPPPDDRPVTVAEVQEGARRLAGVDLDIGENNLLSRFGGATFLAGQYRAGRVFLAGDAAHVHMPFGGQGLNTGIQDAMNLGWKLAAALNGWAPEGLLDTYHVERHPAGEWVCWNTRAQIGLLHPLDRVGALRELLGELMTYDEVSTHVAERLAAVDLRYPTHYPDLQAEDEEHPLQGRRLPPVPLETASGPGHVSQTLHAGRGVLLDLSAGAPLPDVSGWAGRVDVVRAEPTARIDAAFVVLRPDGYVAWAHREPRTDGVLAALTAWFGAPGTSPAGRPGRGEPLVSSAS
ncbi:FAD-dependent monooxygenase [Streptomyces sp. NPDC020983]|uniref:FAD-dependent monooxygenase n=1 Tax=Streptomyces sp. NPDC020983 TaxID=3365106 RepID=UPI0037B451DE